MPSPNKPAALTHALMRQLFSYDAQRGRLVRKMKPSMLGRGYGSGRGNVGDDLPPSKTTGSKYPGYIANVLGHFVNYPRLVWLWHHESVNGRVRTKPGMPKDDFRIENLELYGKSRAFKVGGKK